MNLKKRIDQLENKAEHYQEKISERHGETDKVTEMVRTLGQKRLAKILRRIDGKTPGIPSERF